MHETPPANRSNEEDKRSGDFVKESLDANKFLAYELVFGAEIKPLRNDNWIPFLNIVLLLMICFDA